MSKLIFRVAAKALIRHNERLLLLREPNGVGTEAGKYQIPGGGVEPGERFIDALKREVKEETGLTILLLMPVMVDEWFPEIKGQKYHNIAIFYLCESESDKVQLSHEHDDFVWIKPNEITQYSTPNPVPQLFKTYEALSRRLK